MDLGDVEDVLDPTNMEGDVLLRVVLRQKVSSEVSQVLADRAAAVYAVRVTETVLILQDVGFKLRQQLFGGLLVPAQPNAHPGPGGVLVLAEPVGRARPPDLIARS